MLGFLRSVTLVAVVVAAPFLARPAAAATCSAPDVVSGVPYFTDKMTVATKGRSAVAYVHRDDPRITASFQAAAVQPPPDGTSRQVFARELQAMMFSKNQAAMARGATVTTAVNPFDPVQWRVFSKNDPLFGADRLVGQYGIYITSTCLMTATITAPEGDATTGDAFKRRWNDLVTAMESVRDQAQRVGEPMTFGLDDLSPKGWRAYMIGVALPLLASAVLYFILGKLVTVGQPSLVSRAAAGGIALVSCAIMGGTLLPTSGIVIPVEMRVLIGLVSLIGSFGALWGYRWATLGAICIAVGAGLTLAAYVFFGWTDDIAVDCVLAGLLVFIALAGAMMWGSSRTVLAEA